MNEIFTNECYPRFDFFKFYPRKCVVAFQLRAVWSVKNVLDVFYLNSREK